MVIESQIKAGLTPEVSLLGKKFTVKYPHK